MPTYYVGPGGNNGNDGLTWATRKLTLNGAEDIPVVAADTVVVAPGVYRETLTVDANGESGAPISYVGDVTGRLTTGVGGYVRVTGSDNDQVAVRNSCITATGKQYRNFSGLLLDTPNAELVFTSGCYKWVLEDMGFLSHAILGTVGVLVMNSAGVLDSAFTIRRSQFYGMQNGIAFGYANILNSSNLVENCIMQNIVGPGNPDAISDVFIGGVKIRNCTIMGTSYSAGVKILFGLPSGYTPVTVSHCIICHNTVGLSAVATGQIVEDYNNVVGNRINRTNVAVGANSIEHAPMFLTTPRLFSHWFHPCGVELAPWSSAARRAGDGTEATEDFYGIVRPTVSSKRSWGAIQLRPAERESVMTYGSSGASLKMADAGEHQMQFASRNAPTKVQVRAYREAGYDGTAPQLIVRQPGQADVVITDVGPVGGWNLLVADLVPAALPEWCTIALRSNNTATVGNYATYFDALKINCGRPIGDLNAWKTNLIGFTDVSVGGAISISPAEGGQIV